MLVVPVYNMIIAPDASLYFRKEMLRRSSGGRPIEVNEKVILVVAREMKKPSELTSDSFYPIGLAGTISEIDPQGFVVIDTQYRVDLADIYISAGNTIQLEISRRADIEEPAGSTGRQA